MKRLFLTSLVTIVSVTLLTIIIVSLSLAFKYNKAQAQWRDEAYEDYITYLANLFTVERVAGMSESVYDMKVSLRIFPNDRIAGLYYRSNLSGDSFGLGQSPRGYSIGSSETDQKEKKGFWFGRSSAVTVKDTLFELTFDGEHLSIKQSRDTAPLDFNLPSQLSPRDIAGSATFMMNGKVWGRVYVVTHTPMTYSYSGKILNASLAALVWSIPISLVVSLAVAWLYSYQNTRTVGIIRASLQKIIRPGHEKLVFPKNKNPYVGQIYDSIKELDETLQENRRNRNEWLSSISHDLNTPLASLKITLEGIRDQIFSPSDPSVLATLENEEKLLEKRIGSIIDYSRLQSLKSITVRPFDAKEFAEDVKKLFDPAFSSKIQTDIQTDTLQGDPKLLKEASKELLKNCQAADPEGSSVKWTIKKEGSNFAMVFSNAGTLPPGIDFFEPWSKGDLARGGGGSGMGLPIASRIIALHRGTAVILQSSPGLVTARVSWPAGNKTV